MGNLYIVATPIGNLQDITLRALETLDKVDFIACEDTRKANILINHFFADKKRIMQEKLFSYFEERELERLPKVINILQNDKNVALISDAGTPTISDPGFKLVRECKKMGINVISVPGPTATISALVSSGLPTDKFMFLGFLPQKPGHRKTFLENVKKSQEFISSTLIFFESPYKIEGSLKDMLEIFGDINVTLARELTKVYEDISEEKISLHLKKFEKTKPKGEFTVVFSLK